MIPNLPKLVPAFALVMGVVGMGSGLLARQSCAKDKLDSPALSISDDKPRGVREKEVTAALAQSYKSYVELPRTFWEPGISIEVTAVVSPVPLGAADIAHRKGNWDRMVPVTAKNRRYQVLLKVFRDDTKKEVWRGSHSIDPEPLARLSRSLVPDGKTVYTHFDPDAVLPLQIPAGSLPAGTYRVHLSFLDSDGVEKEFQNAGPLATAPQPGSPGLPPGFEEVRVGQPRRRRRHNAHKNHRNRQPRPASVPQRES
jgi:hypothetical protein